jgi:hypothetical protein
MNDMILKKTPFLVPPLPLVEEAKEKDEKQKATNVIEFILEQRADSTATAPTYKLKVTRFCEGTVLEWINFRKAIPELWRQNGITNTQDRVAIITAILCKDLLTGFEEKIQELTTSTGRAGETVTIEITDKTVSTSLNAVTHMVFPSRSLETQNKLMQRHMQKPKEH